jgi:hypothetical protein
VFLQRLALIASGPMSMAVAQFLRGPLRLFLFVLCSACSWTSWPCP